MNLLKVLLLLVLAGSIVFGQNNSKLLKLKAKVGFINSEDTIKQYKFLENGNKLAIFGERQFQLWDIENAKLIKSFSHNLQEYSRMNKAADIITLGLATTKWSSIEIDPRGRWFLAVEDAGSEKKVVVRNLETGALIAELKSDDFLIDLKLYGEEILIRKKDLVTFGKKKDTTKITVWNDDNFQQKGAVLVSEFSDWYQFIRNDERLLTGSGDTRISWLGSVKSGGILTLWDVAAGKKEKEFTAANLKPKNFYTDASVSKDEKFLMAQREDRVFIWEIDGDGSPKYEIASETPKGSAKFMKVIDGRFIVVKVDKKLRVYEFGGNGVPKYEFISDDPKKSFDFIDSTADGKYFAVGGNGKFSIYETDGAKSPVSEIELPERLYEEAKFVEDGKYYVFSTYQKKDKVVRGLFYDTKTGKIAFEVPFALGKKIEFTPDKKFLYTERLGGTNVWNFAENRAVFIPQKTYRNTCQPNDAGCVAETRNVESTWLSPNGKFIVKYWYGNALSILDLVRGQAVEQIFDPEKVKYDSRNQIKDSGYGDIIFSENGKYLLAFDKSRVYGSHNIAFWELEN